METREDIESDIEDCKEEIYQHSHALRWFTLGVRVFWLGAAIGFISLTMLLPLHIPILQTIVGTIGTISSILSVLVGIVIGAFYFGEADSRNQPIRENQEQLREAKRTLAKLERHLTYFNEQTFNHLPPPEQHVHQLPDLITSYRKRADRYRWRFIVTQIITILLSATITSLSGGWLDKYVSIPWAIPVFSALISILTSFTLFFKFREKGANLQQTADAMDLEYKAYRFGIGVYKGITTKTDALVLFAERTEELRKDQQQRQQQLEQSSHAEQKALQSEK